MSSLDDTITVATRDTWSIERTYFLAAGTAPLDIAVVSPVTAYFTARDGTQLMRLDLPSGEVTPAADLSVFADADGIPDLGMMAVHEGQFFVQIRRVNFELPGACEPPAYLAVVDAATGDLMDVDEETPEIQAIELLGTGPKQKM